MRNAGKLVAFCLASAASTAIAQAQTAPAEPDQPQATAVGADIVVTAQRREQRLIDVPIAVTALSNAALERAGVQTVNDAQAVIPNIQINQTVGNGFSPVISMRGLAPSADTSLARDQPVGLYLDGVPISKSTGAAFDTVDLQRVEVLRGPQGTLYGKNTIGGAINLITQKPTGEFGGQIWLSYGQWNKFQRRISVDLPAISNVKIKLGYSGNDQGGYWHNAATRRDFGRMSQVAARADVLWEPTSNFSARYAYDISNNKGTPTVLAISAIGASFPAALRGLVRPYVFPDRPGPDQVSAQSAIRSNFEVTGHALTLNWDVGHSALGDLTLRSITARRTMKSRSLSDFDGTPVDLVRFVLNNDYESFTQEVQLLGSGAEFKYTLGGFYSNDSYSVYNPRWNFQFGGNNYDLSDRGGGNRSVAGYGQLTWTPSFADKKLDIAVGLRYTSDRKRAYELFLANSAYAANPAAVGSGVFARNANGSPITRSGQPAAGARPGAGGLGPYDLIPLSRRDSWSQVNPEFNIVYRVRPDWSFYGRFATGFKSGGINDTASTNAAFNSPYDPEKLTSYEIGTKFISPDRRVSLNLSAYHSIYKNFQAGVFVPELVTTNIINAGEAKFTGVEVEGSIRPFGGLTINVGGGYLDAKYTDFVLPSGQDVTSTYKIPLAPKWNYLIGGVYRVPVGRAAIEASANWSWRAMQWATITPDTLATRKAYGTLDARIALTDIPLTDHTTAEIALWGRNLTDTAYWNSGINLGVLAVRQWADPRSVGGEVRIRF
ncbi:TonB-dependent receptor [Sphingomonas sp. MMSM20]|uniref:TonB-dependent receptor n=1 Tax=Sphingomonas lycopersici TaxID=2951807 RepID=UPI0022380625|nr:TonB-dependent receptor [Sphingomonas lycopersici]MCW6532581.1 TonB-dependent receptor [Sphingomonas lycopersici]